MGIWFKRDLFTKDRIIPPSKSRNSGRLIPLRSPKSIVANSVLVRMINDCLSLGASEVFIGNPNRQAFQFFAAGETYSGMLPIEAIENIKELLSFRSPISLDWDEIDAQDLRLGVSTDGTFPVYCFSWRKKLDPKFVEEKAEVQENEKQSPSGALILIVDDDLRFSQILSRILEEQGFQTLLASSGKEGLSILEEFEPGLVITDVHMPHLSGPEFLLESRKRGFDAPYLVLTNDEDALTEAELVLLGASAFIKKSEDPRVLLAWCRRLTNVRRVA